MRAVVMLGTFGLRPKGTMSARALPLAQELAARGWRVRMVLPPWDAPELAGTVDTFGAVEVINVRVDGGPVRVVARMLAAAHAHGPAIIHCFKPKGYGGLAATCLRLGGWPLVVDNDDWEGRGGWSDRISGYSPAQRLLFCSQANLLPRSAHVVTAASRLLQAQAWELGVPQGRVYYLPNGVSHRHHASWLATNQVAMSRAAFGLDDGPVVVFYTRFDVVAPGRLVSIIKALTAECPAVQVLIVGGGLAGEDEQVRTEARQAGIADRLRWAGFVPFEQLPAVLRLGDAAIYPIDDSLINRAKAPMKLLEMMALGLPVVAEAVGETREYITPNESGLLVESGDSEALAAAIAAVLQRPDLQQRLGAAAHARIWTRYTWESLVDTAESAYGQSAVASGQGVGGSQT